MKIKIAIETCDNMESLLHFRGWLVGLDEVSLLTQNLKEGNGEIISFCVKDTIDFDQFSQKVNRYVSEHGLEIEVLLD